MNNTQQPESPASKYLRLDACETTAPDSWEMALCVATLANTEDRVYGGYQY